MAVRLSPFAVWGLEKELRVAAEDTRPLMISGPLAAQLEKELARGGEPGAVRVGGRPEDAAVLVRQPCHPRGRLGNAREPLQPDDGRQLAQANPVARSPHPGDEQLALVGQAVRLRHRARQRRRPPS